MNFKVLIGAFFALTIAVVGCDSGSGDNGGTGGTGGTGGSGGGTGGGGGTVARDCANLPDLSSYAITDAPATDATCTTTFSDTGPNATVGLQLAIDDASSGDVVCVAPGTYNLDSQISISRVPLTLQGTGTSPDDVIFNFEGPGSMGGVNVTQADVTVENIWIKNSPGNGIRNSGANSVIRKLHVSWDVCELATPPANCGESCDPAMDECGEALVCGSDNTCVNDDNSNGQYAIYPTENTGTLVEWNQMSGARDAGIYVGKFVNGMVRNNLMHENVMALEVENSDNVQVYDNECVNNTGCLMALQQPLGETERLANENLEWYDNDVWCNNRVNFAPPGGIISFIPEGTGMIVYGGNGVDIHDNNIEQNDFVGVVVVSNTLLCQLTTEDCVYPTGYDPYPKNIWVYDNDYEGNGTMAFQGDNTGFFAELFLFLGWGTPANPTPDVVWDGYIEPDTTDDVVCIGSTNQPSFLNFTQNMCAGNPPGGDDVLFAGCARMFQTQDTTAVSCDKP